MSNFAPSNALTQQSHEQNSPDTKQIDDLQIKVAYLEATLEILNDVVIKQNQELRDLSDALKLVYQSFCTKDSVSAFDLLKDKPPHY